MRSEKADHQDAICILHHDDQAEVIRLDIEHRPTTFENARLGMRLLDVFRCLSLRLFRDRSPGVVLRPSDPDALMASSRCQIALDDVGADQNHG